MEQQIAVDTLGAARVLRAGARMLREQGWIAGDLHSSHGQHCALGALGGTLPLDSYEHAAHSLMHERLRPDCEVCAAIFVLAHSLKRRGAILSGDDTYRFERVVYTWNDTLFHERGRLFGQLRRRGWKPAHVWLDTLAEKLERLATIDEELQDLPQDFLPDKQLITASP